jgi:GxxExxY protein
MPLFNRKPTRGNTDIDPEFRPLIEAGAEVYQQLGAGFEAENYADALAVELKLCEIDAAIRPEFTLNYKDTPLPTAWTPALQVTGDIIIDIVVEDLLRPATEQRMIHSLMMARCTKGVLFNFGSQGFQYRRYVSMEQ